MRSLTADLGKTLETHFVGLRRYATSLIGDYVEAEDLVQECLVRALAHEHVWERVHNRRAYLFTILHNIYVDRRAKYRRNERHVPIDDVAGELHTPPEQHERLEIRDFQRAIEQLPANYKAVTLLVGLEGMSYQQAARSLGVPVGTVMSRLSRGRKMLRRRMNGEDTGVLVDGGDTFES
jgi:RNA polymerase sigma-70 factor (ECF subfamily)